ncbi:4-hydroxybenzoate polyprenyltransferase [Bathymodiolus platifrons methanotrophic gill symbiont]|uniref:4-hydroxybenzoate octaprenyltransferase n=1 Tax=Bathymodiolus platifrons methanotrophic gill symbiont TaxID=113268 RepID=UPI000B414D42|nr:4-hydroxybenzoate octaprenyltransferase [Bathymodiolus platifrons methanotrophic gill symbiont]MCK5870957.1 4-hydroxybenzoate octaprenyltransferase [Methyloprofundus sp.]TXK97475.1 4-hydroxybenzoate polyprenyltransferase [Methylococcaceae bacterium CS5]TXK97518.1 4-hydroxybenzoate polyprenyltransferase [Methylococcaceae bacterium CS4]TXL04408.1 4-hydroxybenzoate polyprenyltransferase [Methylococcaceae bacterium CS3]TXL04975.1 4-hydroxybenzoate polyprenyltransferase [Methylococcaceae bacteri
MNKEKVIDRVQQYWLLARFDKPIGILILLWPALWALWVASSGQPDILVLTVICSGVVLMRAAGCVINDYADRDFDPHVARTKLRPIAAGKVKPKEALVVFAVLCLSAFALVLLLNRYTIMLSFGGAFLAASYPFMKRYTQLPQAYLGIAFGWAVPMSFAAQSNEIPLIAWLMYLATALWALVYDTMYAMVDKEDDLKIGVKSTAILFGDKEREIMAVLQIIVMLLLVQIGYLEGLSWIYYVSLFCASGFFVYQQKLIFYREKNDCFKAFLNSNWFGLTIFIGLVLEYAF